MAIFARSPKTRIFLKSAKKGPRETFERIAYKVALGSKPNSALAQMPLSSNYYALIVERLEKILAEKAAHKVPEWPSYGNFARSPKTRIF